MLLQLWTWERMPRIRPTVLFPAVQGDNFSRGGRWAGERTTRYVPSHVVSLFRDALTKMGADEFIWELYSTNLIAQLLAYYLAEQHIWRSVVPLIYWEVVEFHLPQRVLRQFGLFQLIPASVDTDTDKKLHSLSRSGRSGKDWIQYHSHWVQYWEHRAQLIVGGYRSDPLMPLYEYIVWYQNITARYIAPPVSWQAVDDAHRPERGQFDYLVDSMSRIGSIYGMYLDPANPTQSAHPGLTTIREEAFGALQYLNLGHKTVASPFDRQDIGQSASSAAPFQMPVEHLPREVRGRKQAVRRRRGSTSTHAVDVPDEDIMQISSLSGYDPPIGIHFSHNETFFTPPTMPAFGGHFIDTPTPIPVFDYTFAAAPASTMLATTMCPEIKFQDNLDQMYRFLETSVGFSPALHMDDDSVPISASFQAPIHGSCPRCGQTPVFNPSVDDDDDQIPEQIHAISQRFERLQLGRDLPHERIHWKCGCSTTPRDKGKRRVDG